MNPYDESNPFPREHSGDIGFVRFAGVVAILLGVFHIVAGITGIMDEGLYIIGRAQPFGISGLAWSWFQLIEGIILLIVGFGVFAEAPWAMALGIALAGVGAFMNLAHLPDYPIWSIWMIVFCLAIIAALVAKRRELKASAQPQPQA